MKIMNEMPITRFNINHYAENLIEKDGVFFSRDTEEISYPAEGYDVHFGIEDNSFWFKHRNNCIVSLVRKYAHDRLIFDIGGGNGFVSQGLRGADIQTCLVEPSIEGCLNAKRRGLTNIICADMKNARFKAGIIPAIGLFDVIEHVENDVEFLNYINKILMPEGYLFIAVPAYNILWSNEDIDLGHFRRYTLRALKKVLGETGFEIVYSTYIFSFLIIPILFFRTLPSRLGITKSGGAVKSSKFKKEHNAGQRGIVGNVLAKFMSLELSQIKKSRAIPFGGSCLVVARKV